MDYIKETLYLEIPEVENQIPIGTIGEYINLSESETAKLLYTRLNRHRAKSLSIDRQA